MLLRLTADLILKMLMEIKHYHSKYIWLRGLSNNQFLQVYQRGLSLFPKSINYLVCSKKTVFTSIKIMIGNFLEIDIVFLLSNHRRLELQSFNLRFMFSFISIHWSNVVNIDGILKMILKRLFWKYFRTCKI